MVLHKIKQKTTKVIETIFSYILKAFFQNELLHHLKVIISVLEHYLEVHCNLYKNHMKTKVRCNLFKNINHKIFFSIIVFYNYSKQVYIQDRVLLIIN